MADKTPFEIADEMKPVTLGDMRGIDADMSEISVLLNGMLRAATGMSKRDIETMLPGDKRVLAEQLAFMQDKPYDHPEPEYDEASDSWTLMLAYPLGDTKQVNIRMVGSDVIKDNMSSVAAIVSTIRAATGIASPSLLYGLNMGDVSRIVDLAAPTTPSGRTYSI